MSEKYSTLYRNSSSARSATSTSTLLLRALKSSLAIPHTNNLITNTQYLQRAPTPHEIPQRKERKRKPKVGTMAREWKELSLPSSLEILGWSVLRRFFKRIFLASIKKGSPTSATTELYTTTGPLASSQSKCWYLVDALCSGAGCRRGRDSCARLIHGIKYAGSGKEEDGGSVALSENSTDRHDYFRL